MEDDFEDLELHPGPCMRHVANIQSKFESFFHSHGHIVRYVVYGILLASFTAYFAYAMYYEQLTVIESITLLWITCLTIFCVVISAVKDKWGDEISKGCCGPMVEFIEGRWQFFKM